MKISFSTLGCPNWVWSEILSAAKDLGYDGIELRGLGSDLFIPQAKLFLPENVEKTRASLEAAGLEIPCISTECYLPSVACLEKLTSYIELARTLGVKYLRVLGDLNPWPDESVSIDAVKKTLALALGDAQDAGITLLCETNGIFADSLLMRSLIESMGSENLRVLWDLNHPVRYFGESPERTWENLSPYVRHVHLKDSVSENGHIHYKMLGHGTLPIAEMLALLKRDGYKGYLSLEWTKRWHDELEDAGIVFSHFVHKLNRMIENA